MAKFGVVVEKTVKGVLEVEADDREKAFIAVWNLLDTFQPELEQRAKWTETTYGLSSGELWKVDENPSAADRPDPDRHGQLRAHASAAGSVRSDR